MRNKSKFSSVNALRKAREKRRKMETPKKKKKKKKKGGEGSLTEEGLGADRLSNFRVVL